MRPGTGPDTPNPFLFALLACLFATGVARADASSAGNPCKKDYPLPVAAHWTADGRWQPKGTVPRWQLQQIDAGHHWLLSFPIGRFQQTWDEAEEAFYRPAIDEARKRKLPIAILTTQWDRVLYENAPWKDAQGSESALEIDAAGNPLPKVSPFGAVAPFAEAGAAWAQTPVLKRLRELYPDPPYVLIVSNNEPKRLKIQEIPDSIRFQRQFGTTTSEDFQRRAAGDGYIERYKAMVEGLRSALGSWRERATLIGWGGTNVRMGGGQWKNRNLPLGGLPVPGRLNITPFIWDGISARYYVVNFRANQGEDYTLRSPNAEVMNLPLEVEFACEQRDRYFLELSTWFDPVFVERIAQENAAIPPPQRYAGAVQWGMWIARPRVVREFSYGRLTLPEYQPFLETVMEAVDQVHRDPDLASFWRASELVRNPKRRHPIAKNIPAQYHAARRWANLDTNLDPPEPWSYTTELPVWALARRQGVVGSRRWLIYAQSPRHLRKEVRLALPGFGEVPAIATPSGCFYIAEEKTHRVRPLAANGAGCGNQSPR